ncbi:DeoR/GlpR family DNA-binding transcription regulator [Fodinicola feengrottensis]|uniref:DeoR/GlpR family DNA-binding transcription regulator n=1 Tax=Fodinicola feengrottensis TaxID=435914 RepID=A0ABP4U5F8_9ACTN
MPRHERWNALLEALARDGQLGVEQAASELGVSTATIRRDLDELAEQRMLTRTRGGAVLTSVSYDLPLRYKTARHAQEKLRIARAAASLVEVGWVVALNGGTTSTEVARSLAESDELAASSVNPALTIVTNALNIANELAVRPHIKIVVTGGVARPQSYELVGPLSSGILDLITLDAAVIGVDGIDVRHGATAHNESEAGVNTQMVGRARRVIVVADSSKLGVGTFARICSIDKVDVLITDEAADLDMCARFTDAGVEVQRV